MTRLVPPTSVIRSFAPSRLCVKTCSAVSPTSVVRSFAPSRLGVKTCSSAGAAWARCIRRTSLGVPIVDGVGFCCGKNVAIRWYACHNRVIEPSICGLFQMLNRQKAVLLLLQQAGRAVAPVQLMKWSCFALEQEMDALVRSGATVCRGGAVGGRNHDHDRL
jgi:hypothetical protein